MLKPFNKLLILIGALLLPLAASADMYGTTCSSTGPGPGWVTTFRCHAGNTSNNDYIYVKNFTAGCTNALPTGYHFDSGPWGPYNVPTNNTFAVTIAPVSVGCPTIEPPNRFWEWWAYMHVVTWVPENTYDFAGEHGHKTAHVCGL